jgi:hypothetical protein
MSPEASGCKEIWAVLLILTSSDCPDPWVSTGGGRGLSRKASYSRGSASTRGGSRGRAKGGKKGAAKPRSKMGAFGAADD